MNASMLNQLFKCFKTAIHLDQALALLSPYTQSGPHIQVLPTSTVPRALQQLVFQVPSDLDSFGQKSHAPKIKGQFHPNPKLGFLIGNSFKSPKEVFHLSNNSGIDVLSWGSASSDKVASQCMIPNSNEEAANEAEYLVFASWRSCVII